MAIEAREVLLYIRKFLLFSIKTSYRTARGHPLISAVVFFMLMLYRIFPSLFAFLVTSSPVIICTALLLGTLLSYGTPNIPKIEEANKTTHDVSSMQAVSGVGNLVTKKDGNAETSTDVIERTVEEEVGNETASGTGIRRDDTLLLATSFVDGDTKERELYVQKQPDGALGPGDVGLTVHIAKPESDNLLDSSLGSPWQQIDSHDASSGSDSDSSGSSSPDASMADILPMLDELHPLLDSEHPRATLRSTAYSDSSSGGSSRDDESDGGTAEEEIENKEDRGKEAAQEEERGGNEDAVTWNADDQKNVMDLGVSELERNRRLESLIEKRRVRKLIRYETEKNLIDLDSYYPTPMPSISAPRRNPFDHSYDSVPGSAPSALHRRENPFDLPYDQVERISSFSREYLSHHDFVPPQNESSALGSSYSDDLREEKDDSNLKSYTVAEGIEYTALRRQPSEESDSKSSSESESNKASSVTEREDHGEAQVRRDRNLLHPANLDDERVDVGGDPSTVVIEEEIGEAAPNLPLSDSVKSEIAEERYEQSNSSTSNEESSETRIHEESSNLLQSDTATDMPVANPVYDSSSSSVGKTVSNTSSLDEALHYEGKDDFASSSLPYDAQEVFSGVVSPPTVENRDYVEVKETAAEESSLSKASSSASSLDETESRSMVVAEIKDHDDIRVETSEATEDAPEPADGGIMPVSGLHEILTQSEVDYITDVPSSREESAEAGVKESNVSILADDFKFGNEHESAIEPGLQVIEDLDLLPKATENISNEDDLVPGAENGDDLVASFAIPIQAEGMETSDSIHSEENVTEIKEIDEGLLSELDAVSDFQVNKEIKIDQEDFDSLDHSEDTLRIREEVNPVMDHPSLLEDPELTVHDSTLHVLEELDSVFDQHHEKKFDKDPEVEETLPQPQVLEQEPIDDINFVPNQSSAGTNADQDVAYIEAKSLEDIDLAFKQLSGGAVKNANPPEFSQGEASQRQLESEVSEGTSSISRNSEW